MNFISRITIVFSSLICATLLHAQKVDYSVVQVPQEKGTQLVKITNDNDYVCMPIVKRNRNGVNWFTNRIIDVSPDGQDIAYISDRNNGTNIFPSLTVFIVTVIYTDSYCCSFVATR